MGRSYERWDSKVKVVDLERGSMAIGVRSIFSWQMQYSR